jgi:hypothetical protein
MVFVARRSPGGSGRFFLATGLSMLILAPALVVLIAKRRAFQRRSIAFQRTVIVLCWLVTLVGFAAFTASVR